MADDHAADLPAIAWLKRRWGRLRPGPAPAGQPPSPPQPRVAVVTDSSAALPEEWTAEFEHAGCFASVVLPVMAGDEIFTDGDDADTALSIALAAGRPVRTSRPAPGQFERVYRGFEQAGFDGIVSLHLSGKLSGTADAARVAAERVGLPVDVVDSRTAGMALGFAVRAAVRAAAEGADAATVRAAALRGLTGAEVFFYVPSLEQLRRGGRIGAAASLVGTVLAIKPILCVRDGLIVPLERIRTAARAVPRLRELAVQAARGRRTPALAVHYFGNRGEAERFAADVAGDLGLPTDDVALSPMPAVLAAHTGLGVLAVIVAEAG
ncbi:DegV domain-containing protein [Sinomonas cyclohexanicum]|uniref:DegV domain-containing protein n=1 Tax=Sinomonas cyclohexanicum TaxID=322009 RepID=A0ABN6FI53_SINCY|nr:DegV family protein [Corynebacterium cyclohexanicum]BCT76314.1 DegV domain-containing protein [Corynebacterium cyclohexanicum]